MERLNWLHLSDIHFNYENFDVKRMRELLVHQLEVIIESTPVHFIVITGDIVFKCGNYSSELFSFLNQVLQVCHLDVNHLFMVPGNHDLKRTQARTAMIDSLQRDEIFEDIDGSLKKELLKSQEAFYKFYTGFKGGKSKEKEPYWTFIGEKYNIIHINTALICGKDGEEGRLKIDLSEMLKAVEKVKKSENLSIAIGHHTLECLSETNRKKVFYLFEDYGVDLYLCGHLHKMNCCSEDLGTKALPEIVSGAGICGKYGEAGFVFGSFDRESANCQLVFYHWDNENDQWVVTPEVNRKTKDGSAFYAIERLKKTHKPDAQKASVSETEASVELYIPIPLNAKYFGRNRLLNKAKQYLENQQKAVVCFWGLAGTGKSSFIDKLIRDIAPTYMGAKHVFSWHFYSQEDQPVTNVDTALFFDKAIRFFSNGNEEPLKAEFQKVNQLLSILKKEKFILILDGIEVLLNPPYQNNGYFRDQAMYQFLSVIAREGLSNGGLILITSRHKIVELERYRTNFINIPMSLLTQSDAVRLLKYYHLKGSDEEFKAAVEEYKYHPLALTLFARILNDLHGGILALRNDITRLSDFHDNGQTVERLLQYYCTGWSYNQPEKIVMMYLALFKRPATYEELDVLIRNNEISKELCSDSKLAITISNLKKIGLLLENKELDTHALIREYFYLHFIKEYPEIFLKCNRILFSYYEGIEIPEEVTTVEQLDPLYRAIYYGCQARLFNEALQILWEKIFRERRFFSHRILGAVSNDFFAISQFFEDDWSCKEGCSLAEADQAWLLAVAAYLCSLSGRLRESVVTRSISLKLHRKLGDQQLYMYDQYRLSDCYLLLMEIRKAKQVFESEDFFEGETNQNTFNKNVENRSLRVSWKSRKAFTYFLNGCLEKAKLEFEEAETEFEDILGGTNGYYYFCFLLYSNTEKEKLEQRVMRYCENAELGKTNYEISLGKWMKGVLKYLNENYDDARLEFEAAIQQMVKSGRLNKLPVLHIWLCKSLLSLYRQSRHKQFLQLAIEEIDKLRIYVDVYQMKLYEPNILLLESNIEELQEQPVQAQRSLQKAKKLSLMKELRVINFEWEIK